MPKRKAGDTHIARLEAMAEGHGRSAGHVLASLLRRYDEAEVAERLGMSRGTLTMLKMQAGVWYAGVVTRDGDEIHVIHGESCRI